MNYSLNWLKIAEPFCGTISTTINFRRKKYEKFLPEWPFLIFFIWYLKRSQTKAHDSVIPKLNSVSNSVKSFPRYRKFIFWYFVFFFKFLIEKMFFHVTRRSYLYNKEGTYKLFLASFLIQNKVELIISLIQLVSFV